MFDTIGVVVLVILAILVLLRVGYGLYGYIFLDWTFAEAFGVSGDGGDGGGDGGGGD